jgi:hypothetical protein
LKDGRARPKSQTLSLQSAFARMFLGFRSLWNTLAACHHRGRHGNRGDYICQAACTGGQHEGRYIAVDTADSMPGSAVPVWIYFRPRNIW